MHRNLRLQGMQLRDICGGTRSPMATTGDSEFQAPGAETAKDGEPRDASWLLTNDEPLLIYLIHGLNWVVDWL